MNRFTDTDINELNKLLENDTNKYLFFVRPCYENHSPIQHLRFIIYLDQTVLTTTIILMICI
jgi:hypothetical protein